MKRKSFMLIAGETSGDALAAELVEALRCEVGSGTASCTWDYQPLYGSFEPRFFGAGGPQMAATGVDLAFDMTAHSVTGISDVLKNYPKFRRLFKQLYELAISQEPDAIICVDFSGFNRRFAHAVREYVHAHQDWFHDWNPKIIQYVSPQVWASRESRVYQMARDFDLVLSIFPFERDWYAARVPGLRVEFVGHPVIDRYVSLQRGTRNEPEVVSKSPTVLLLPGSRPDELARHLPILLQAIEKIRAEFPQVRAQMALPNEALAKQATKLGMPGNVQLQIGGLAEALRVADLAIASTGTVTLECAYFRVPTVALYKTSWLTWQVAKRIVTVKYAAMPNLLVDEEVFPEFIQDAATPGNVARAAIELLRDAERRQKMKEKLAGIVASLGTPGAAKRAARAVMETLGARVESEPAQCAYL